MCGLYFARGVWRGVVVAARSRSRSIDSRSDRRARLNLCVCAIVQDEIVLLSHLYIMACVVCAMCLCYHTLHTHGVWCVCVSSASWLSGRGLLAGCRCRCVRHPHRTAAWAD